MGDEGEVDRVLSAKNFYEVLDISPSDYSSPTLDSDSQSKLRRIYLKKSVKTHPDKNAHEIAEKSKEAFQKVSEAYRVLSDDALRQEYNNSQATASGGGGGSGDGSYNDYSHGQYQHDSYSYRTSTSSSPSHHSFEEALFMFATITSGMMGGSKMGNSVAQSLYWAEKFLNSKMSREHQQQDEYYNQSHDRSRGEFSNNPNANEVNLTREEKAHAAMALGSGLRAVAVGANLLGFKNLSKNVERGAAIAETVGVGQMVTSKIAQHNPEAANLIEEKVGGEIRKRLGGLSSSLFQKQKK